MFCEKCGAQNPENAAFCGKCGAKLGSRSTTAAKPAKVRSQLRPSGTFSKGERHQDKKVGMIAVAVVAIIILIAAFALFGGRSYHTAIKQFVNATFEVDGKKMLKLVPGGVINGALEDAGFDDRDEMIEEIEEALQDSVDYIELYLGEDWSVSYEITGVENVSGNTLKRLKKTYEKYDVKVSAAKTAEVEFTVKAGETESGNSMEISLIKVGNSWYIDVESMGGIF